MRIEVLYLGGGERKVIGELTETESGGVFFEYNQEWVKRGIELSPVYLPISQVGVVNTPTPEYGVLFGLFSDSLPDWWGAQMMRYFFNDKGIPWSEVSVLQKLACTGKHAMGAIGYQLPASNENFRDELTVEVAELVSNAHSFIYDSSGDFSPGFLRSGLSSGGAQPKVLLGFNDDFTESMAGGGRLPSGFSRWLMKFDLDPEYETGKEEYAFALMARAAGIRMAHTQLLEGENGTHHFLSKRFDRPGNTRRHVHTFSGVTHTSIRNGLEYGDLLDITRVVTGSEVEVEEMFCRACFNVLAGNEDDHAKNHAFLMQPDGSWSASPAYDITRSSNPLVSGVRAAAVNGKSVDVSQADLLQLGESQGVSDANSIIERVITAINDWPLYAKEAKLSSYRTRDVADEMPGTQGD